MFTQSPCDHEEACACYAQGHSDGREQAHEELRGWDHEAHDPDCNCDPCLTSAAVLMAFMPGLVRYPDLRTLHTERGGVGADEIVCGYFNYDGREPPVKLAGMLRVAYNCDTGDWYAEPSLGEGPAVLLGVITPLMPKGAVERGFADCALHEDLGRPLGWYRRRIAEFNASELPVLLALLRTR